MKKLLFIIMVFSLCITSYAFAEENKNENASDTQKITQMHLQEYHCLNSTNKPK